MPQVAERPATGSVCPRSNICGSQPIRIIVDNGSEFSGRTFDLLAYHRVATIDLNRPGKPTDNCFVATFNRSLRNACPSVHWFETIDEAKAKIEAWRLEYNESRPMKGGSIVTGHPFAATGARIVATLAETISEAGRGRGLISICAAGGQAVTAVIEK